MPFYRYQAVNPSGQPIQGSIQSDTERAALDALVQQGFSQVRFGSAAPIAQPTRRPVSAPNVPQATPRPPVSPARVAPATPAIVKSKKSTAKARFFLFSQLAAATKSGIAPHAAFGDIGARVTDESIRTAMQHVSARSAEGGSIAEAMRTYPDVFPPDVIAMTETGELGGFLPEAFDEISQQAQRSHHYNRWYWWFGLVAANAVLAIPLMQTAMNALIEMWRAADKSGGANTSFQSNWDIQVKQLFQRDIVWIGPIWLFAVGGYLLFRSRLCEQLRHRLGATLPILGPRARHEAYARLAWSLGRLMQAGLAPQRAMQLSAETIPNLFLADRLKRAASGMNERSRLSEVFAQTRIAPEEFAPMIATAEYTGDLPGALHQLAKSSEAEFERSTTYSKFRFGIMGIFIVTITGLIIACVLAYTWYVKLPAEVLQGLEPT